MSKAVQSCLGTIFADVLSQSLQILGNHLESLGRPADRAQDKRAAAFAAAAAMTDRSVVQSRFLWATWVEWARVLVRRL